MEDSDDLQFDNICRICITPSPTLTPIFDKKLFAKIQEIVPVQIHADDGLPSNLCNECVCKVLRWNQFKELIINTDTKLRSILALRQSQGKIVKIENVAKDEPNVFDLDSTAVENIVVTPDAPDDNKDIESDPLLDTSDSTTIKSESTTENGTETKVHKCNECNKEFASRRILSRHNRATHGYMCDQCDKRFLLLSKLNLHILTHNDAPTEAPPFECDVCKKAFKLEKWLNEHKKKHTEVQSVHVCDICSKTFKHKKSLIDHQKRHRGDRPFMCAECGTCYISKSDLKNHIDYKHKKLRPHMCSECGKTFHANAVMLDHYNRVHNKDEANHLKHKCEHCDKMFGSTTELKVHTRTHTGEKPYKCSFCGRAFTTKTHRLHHERIHTGEKPHVCHYCEKRFIKKTTMQTHMRVHTGEKPYTCNVCQKAFNQCSALKTHMKTHNR